MKRISLGLGLAVLLVFGSLQLAGADTKEISDPEGDAISNLDVVAASAGHQGKKIKHTIKVSGDLDELVKGNDKIKLQISTDKDADCEKELIYPPRGKRHVIKCGIGNAPQTARIEEASEDTLKMTFSPKAIGNPDKYRWRVETTTGCSSSCVDQDFAPDEDGGPVYVVHKLK